MKIYLTKYKNPNSINYLSNEYTLNPLVGDTSWAGFLKLHTYPSLSKIYYCLDVYQFSSHGQSYLSVSFSLYSDSGYTTPIATGTFNMDYANIYGDVYNWHKLPLLDATVDGYLIVNLVNLARNGALTHYGYIDCRTTIDWLSEEKLLLDSVTGLDEQYIDNFSIEYKCSDFDIKLSNLTGTQSYLGYTPFEFLQETNEDEFIRVVILEGSDILRTGTIDYKSIEYNYNTGDDNNTVRFKVYDLHSDLALSNSGSILLESITSGADFANTNALDNFHIFMGHIVNALGCEFSNSTNFDAYYYTQTGSLIVLNTDFLNQNKEQNLFEWFKEICKCGGMLFKVNITTCTLNGWDKPTLTLFYPNGNNTSVTISKVIEETQGDKGFNYGAVSIEAGDVRAITATDDNYFIYIQKINSFNYYLAYKIENIYYAFDSGGTKIDLDRTVNIDLIKYDFVSLHYPYNTKKAVAGNTFKDDSVNDLWFAVKHLFVNRYKFLLNNSADTIEITVPFTTPFEVGLYNKFSYKDKWWYIEKISDIDLINKTYKINATEVWQLT